MKPATPAIAALATVALLGIAGCGGSGSDQPTADSGTTQASSPTVASTSSSSTPPTTPAPAPPTTSASSPAPPSASHTSASNPANLPTIDIMDYMYSGDMSLEAGQRVKVTNQDSVAHTVSADQGDAFNLTVPAGETKTFTAPRQPGMYPYHCDFHSNMHGTLNVR